MTRPADPPAPTLDTVLRVWNEWRESLHGGAFTHSDGLRFVRAITAALSCESPAHREASVPVEALLKLFGDPRVRILARKAAWGDAYSQLLAAEEEWLRDEAFAALLARPEGEPKP